MIRHTTTLRQGARRRGGFTLVELVIVGALIAIFSGLAVFGVQQQFRSNIRKAAIAETRQIASALDFASLDTSIFPKLCWMTESEQGLRFFGTQVEATSPLLPFVALDINCRFPTGTASQISVGSRAASQWRGPYFALSQSRGGLSQGRGGNGYMILPDLPQTGPNNPAETGGFRWPLDPYNNPYVVYMLDIDRTTTPGTPRLRFVNATSAVDATRKGNFVNAVVSYGPNHYPGGDELRVGDFGPRSAGLTQLSDAGNAPFAYRLYTGPVGFRPDTKGLVTHRYLVSADFTDQRANLWSRDFALANLGLYGGVTNLPGNGGAAGLADSNANVICITDPGTDDVIFEF